MNAKCLGHTLDTMFANKLYAATARYHKNGKLAGRNFYDIHQFFKQEIPINTQVIEDMSGNKYLEYIKLLRRFIYKRLTKTILIQDLNMLLPMRTVNPILPDMKEELLGYLDLEINKSKSILH